MTPQRREIRQIRHQMVELKTNVVVVVVAVVVVVVGVRQGISQKETTLWLINQSHPNRLPPGNEVLL